MSMRKFWGWGNEGHQLPPGYLERYLPMIESMFQSSDEGLLPVPDINEIDLRSPRFDLTPALRKFCVDNKFERLNHTYGKAFRDIWRAINGRWENPPDYVAFPHTETEIQDLMSFASSHHVALIPYGGGSSVCGGIEAPASDHWSRVISVDLRNFNRMLDIDAKSRSAHFQAGMLGPDLEKALKPYGLTLRHFPQSFEFSTLGGWIATRSGGHYATLYTHIDSFVQSIRMITPSGTMETRRLPSHGAGPSEEHFVCGTEGSLGIITSAWMRLQDVPAYKDSRTVGFKNFRDGVEACRQISQSGLHPSNARLIDPMEAFGNGIGDGSQAILILGFESAHHPVDHWMKLAVSLAESCGGIVHKKAEKTSSKASAWKSSFFSAPYLRDELIRRGIIVETFETSITWDEFDAFHKAIIHTAEEAIHTHAGTGFITTRFTHLYPDGPAPYYTIMAKGRPGHQLEQWDAMKEIMSSRIIELGGSITHHHAVGKDHRPYYEKQRSALFGDVLKAAKSTVDPGNIMNPETLIKM